MSFLDSIVLGVIEGITEFLPISSTGHLILAGHILGLDSTDFVKSFEITIQLGAILAVVVLFWRRLFLSKKVFLLVSAAFIPTAIIGFILYKIIKNVLLGSNVVVLSALAIGGFILIVFEMWVERRRENNLKYALRNSIGIRVPRFNIEQKDPIVRIEDMGYGRAIGVGLFQALAVIPGVSRSAATIVGGILLRMSRVAIVEFSFLLAVPTMLAATGYDLLKSGASFSGNEFSVLFVGFVVSFVVAFGAVKWLIGFIKNHSFIGFGVYRIVLAIVFALFLL